MAGEAERIAELDAQLAAMTADRDEYKNLWQWGHKQRAKLDERIEKAEGMADGAIGQALARLTELTEASARHAGWLPDEELLAAYQSDAQLTRLNLETRHNLTPAQRQHAEALIAAQEQAEAQAAMEQRRATDQANAVEWVNARWLELGQKRAEVDAELALATVRKQDTSRYRQVVEDYDRRLAVFAAAGDDGEAAWNLQQSIHIAGRVGDGSYDAEGPVCERLVAQAQAEAV